LILLSCKVKVFFGKLEESCKKQVTIQVTIALDKDMLSSEEAIQQGVNQAGLQVVSIRSILLNLYTEQYFHANSSNFR